MMELKPNIKIYKEEIHTIIQIWGWELTDFVEDYLVEKCDIDYEFIKEIRQEQNNTNKKCFNLYFSDKYSYKQLLKAIEKLDSTEINRMIDLEK